MRRINWKAQALLAQRIATVIHWGPGHSGLPGNEEAVCQANLARDACGDTMRERPYTSASNRARRISEGRTAAKAKWEADKCRKHFSYRLKCKTGTKRPVLMTSMKSLATRVYRLQCRHAPNGVYLKRFGHREDDKCCWCVVLKNCSRTSFRVRVRVGTEPSPNWQSGLLINPHCPFRYGSLVISLPV